jgi:predicted phage tail protein
MSNTFLSYGAKNITTTGNTIYTVPTATQSVGVGLVISNTSPSPIAANVAVSRSSVSYYIVNGATVPVGGSLVVAGVDQKLVLQANDAIVVTSSANNSSDVWFSVLQIQ